MQLTAHKVENLENTRYSFNALKFIGLSFNTFHKLKLKIQHIEINVGL